MRENKNKKILIFGGSGFLGKNLINMLGEFDFEIIVFSQKKTLEKKNLKYIPQNNFKIVGWSLDNIQSIENHFLKVEAVINLCGILYENKRGDFYRVHSDLPAILGKMSSKHNVRNLIHISALGVSENSKSKYSSSKASGERRLLENFPNAKILRPSLLFGHGDNFFGQFSQMASISPVLPLISRSTKFQPISVIDVATGIINLLIGKRKKNALYELGGRSTYSFEELLKMLLEVKKIKRKYDFIIIDSPPAITFETLQIIKASNGVFVPVQPSPLDLMATLPFLQIAREEKKKPLIILNRVMPRAKLTDAMILRLRYSGAKIARSRISSKVIFAESFAVGRGVIDINETSDAAKEIVNVGNEILRNL